MIKATIQNIPYCTEIVFPCTETELSKKLGELGMNPEHLAPIATVIEIEPSELTVLTDCDVRRYIEEHEMAMADFVTLALQDELHPRLYIQEDKNMGNMRTMAFQVTEDLFQKIKDYLQRNNMTQKQFVIGLIENEIERDLTQRAAMSKSPIDSERVAEEHPEQQETAAVSDCESVSEEVWEQPKGQESTDFSDGFAAEDADEDEELYEEQDEGMGMAMGM